ncbi:MAG: hypothetical protein QXK47_03470 [Candidatus Bathyarchaeia archaeon]
MVSATIDHLVATTVLIVAFTLFMGLFGQVMHDALLYQFHMHLATKCSDTLDNILLSFGDMPGVFGLGDYNLEPYTLDPYLVMRLLSATGPLVEFPPDSGIKYSNITDGFGGYLLVPASECVDYETAQELLGLERMYGFRLSLNPIIQVTFENQEHDGTSLDVRVVVRSFSSPIEGAEVKCTLLYVTGVDDNIPKVKKYAQLLRNETDGKGEAYFTFSRSEDPNLNVSLNYVIIVHVKFADFTCIGYKCKDPWTTAAHVIPFIKSTTNGSLLLVHPYPVRVTNNMAALHYNATYYALDNEWALDNGAVLSVGHVNYASGKGGKFFNETQIPGGYLSRPGILVVFCYKDDTDEYGVSIMPWMVQSLSFSVEFGGDPYGWEWVATDVRHVLIGGVPYLAKLALWSLTGYQVVGYRW